MKIAAFWAWVACNLCMDGKTIQNEWIRKAPNWAQAKKLLKWVTNPIPHIWEFYWKVLATSIWPYSWKYGMVSGRPTPLEWRTNSHLPFFQESNPFITLLLCLDLYFVWVQLLPRRGGESGEVGAGKRFDTWDMFRSKPARNIPSCCHITTESPINTTKVSPPGWCLTYICASASVPIFTTSCVIKDDDWQRSQRRRVPNSCSSVTNWWPVVTKNPKIPPIAPLNQQICHRNTKFQAFMSPAIW